MKKIINTLNAPAPIGPYSQAILSNNVLYVSGQIPLEPGSMKLIEGSLEDENYSSNGKFKSCFRSCENDI